MHPYDSVVLVTGASGGVGAAAAEAFDRAGAKVALAGSDRAALESVAARMSDALVIPTDLSRAEDAEAIVERVVERFGRIDVLINNAATSSVQSSDRLTRNELRRSMELNFVAPMAMTLAAVRAMRAQGRGQIVNVSAAGYLVGMPLMAAYAASKAAFSSWTRTMQAEWAGSEIDVTEFYVGYVEPDPGIDEIGEDLFDDVALSPWAGLLIRAQSPEEIARRLVDCVRNPRSSVYSSLSARAVAWTGLFARLRVPLGAHLATMLRARIGVAPFASSERDTGAAGGVAAAPTEETEAPRRQPSARPVAEVPALQVEPKASPSSASPEKPAVGGAAAAPASGRAGTKETTRKRTAAKKSADKSGATKRSAAKKKTTKRAAKKVAVLSPEAAERVRAAAERAAASAKGDSPGADKQADDNEGDGPAGS
jgi:short-subunit dehydrogenase